MKKRTYKKLFAPLIIFFVALVGVGTAFVFAPHSQVSQVRAVSPEYENGEHIVTFKTIDGEVIASIFTIDGRIPVEYIPNAPQINFRPFLRWTNVQGFSLDGVFTQDVTFLPLYSYDPQWQVDGNGNGTGGIYTPPNQTQNGAYKKTHWLFMNYILDENAVIFGSLIGIGALVVIVFIFLILLRRVFR